MSNYYYPPSQTPQEEEEFDFSQAYPPATTQPFQANQLYAAQSTSVVSSHQQLFNAAQPVYHPAGQYQPIFDLDTSQHPAWMTPIVPSNAQPLPSAFQPFSETAAFPPFSETFDYSQEMVSAGPSTTSAGYLSPEEATQTRSSRAASFTSNASSAPSLSQSDVSRSVSPNASEMAKWGFKNSNGSWSCAYPGCSSKSTFNRGCDLRKHYKRHTKSLFCRHEGCPQATAGGFSSKKDRARHEAKHNPNIVCEWDGCDRLFSRVDNMKDHVRRVHRKRLAE